MECGAARFVNQRTSVSARRSTNNEHVCCCPVREKVGRKFIENGETCFRTERTGSSTHTVPDDRGSLNDFSRRSRMVRSSFEVIASTRDRELKYCGIH